MLCLIAQSLNNTVYSNMVKIKENRVQVLILLGFPAFKSRVNPLITVTYHLINNYSPRVFSCSFKAKLSFHPA